MIVLAFGIVCGIPTGMAILAYALYKQGVLSADNLEDSVREYLRAKGWLK